MSNICSQSTTHHESVVSFGLLSILPILMTGDKNGVIPPMFGIICSKPAVQQTARHWQISCPPLISQNSHQEWR